MFNLSLSHHPTTLGEVADELEADEVLRPVMQGRIYIGEFSESLLLPLDEWSVDNYKKQWTEAGTLLANGADKSCFIVAIHPPRILKAVMIWGVWRRPDKFIIQNLHFFR